MFVHSTDSHHFTQKRKSMLCGPSGKLRMKSASRIKSSRANCSKKGLRDWEYSSNPWIQRCFCQDYSVAGCLLFWGFCWRVIESLLGVHAMASASANIQISRLENQHEAKGCKKSEHFIGGHNNHASVLACLTILFAGGRQNSTTDWTWWCDRNVQYLTFMFSVMTSILAILSSL